MKATVESSIAQLKTYATQLDSYLGIATKMNNKAHKRFNDIIDSLYFCLMKSLKTLSYIMLDVATDSNLTLKMLN